MIPVLPAQRLPAPPHLAPAATCLSFSIPGAAFESSWWDILRTRWIEFAVLSPEKSVANSPGLVLLDASHIRYADIKADGTDLRATGNEGTPSPHLVYACMLVFACLGALRAEQGSGSTREPVGWRPAFTRLADTAQVFGVHEVFFTRDHTPANPFDEPPTVTFTPPAGPGAAKPVTVDAFFDGGAIWRARLYVTAAGRWTWRSECRTDPKLHGHEGAFIAEASTHLRGRLLRHPGNPHQWITEDQRWFLNLNDTAYLLFLGRDRVGGAVSGDDFQRYVRSAALHGITSVRSMMACSFEQSPTVLFATNTWTLLDLERFQLTDVRLQWMLDHHPDLYVQLILLPLAQGWGKDDREWAALPAEARTRLLRHVVARFAAFPQLFWLVTNDAHYGPDHPNNDTQAREVGQYLRKHDPWQHPISTGPYRGRDFPFPEEPWVTYLHLERSYDLDAIGLDSHRRWNKPVFNGEDRYEQDHAESHDPTNMRYFQRRLFWAWLLGGGSANYGGRFPVVHPYDETGSRSVFYPWAGITHARPLVGLDSVAALRRYFVQRPIDLGWFEPDATLVSDAATNSLAAPKCMRRGTREFLAYHPHAGANGQRAIVAHGTAGLRLDLTHAQGRFQVEWFRAADGMTARGKALRGGKIHLLKAPWPGNDVVVHLVSDP
jgi:hypothetical protein